MIKEGDGMSDMPETLFSKIIRKEIPADIVYEDDKVLCFRDIHPVAPVHLLLIPKIVIPKLQDVTSSHAELMGYLMAKVPMIASQENIADAYRCVVNNGAGAGQTVYHLHVHIIAGRAFNWPPG